MLVEGQERAQLEEFVQEESYLLGRLSLPEQEQEPEDTIKEAMLRVIRDLLMRYSSVNTKLNKETIRQLAETQDLGYMLDQIANNMPLSYEKKQRLLEAYDLSERYEEIAVILNNEIEVFRIRREFQEEVRKRIDQNQKEYILREQMKLISWVRTIRCRTPIAIRRSCPSCARIKRLRRRSKRKLTGSAAWRPITRNPPWRAHI